MNNEFDFYNGFSVGYKIFNKSEIGNWNSLGTPDPDPDPTPPSTPKGVQFACGTSYINGKRVIGAYFDGNNLCARRGIEDPEIEEPTEPDVNDFGRLTLTIDTRKRSSSNRIFTLSFRKILNRKIFDVNWGDGTLESSLPGIRRDGFLTSFRTSLSHTYPKPGKYTITITSRSLLGLEYEGFNTFGQCILNVSFPDDAWLWGASFNGAFTDCTNLRTINWPRREPFGINLGALFSALLFGTNTFSFDRAFMNCTSLTFFDFIDTSSSLSFFMTWANCTSLTALPNLDYSKASTLVGTFSNTALKSWDCIGTLKASNYENAWFGCQRLVNFPAGKFDNTNFNLVPNAFEGTFEGCALSAQSIRNILQSLVNNGSRNVTLSLNGGTNAAKSTWDSVTKKRYNTLVKRGWKISFNP